MIDVIDFDGNRKAFAYSHLYRVDFNPSTGLQLEFSEHQVTFTGSRLSELYQQLKRHRVTYIAVADYTAVKLANPKDSVVTGVVIRSRADLLRESVRQDIKEGLELA